MPKDNQPTDAQVKRDADALERHLGASGVMGYAKQYLQNQREASRRSLENQEYEAAMKLRTEKAQLFDQKIDRLELERPNLGFKYMVLGRQELVDQLAEKIKDGDLTAFLDALDKCDGIGATIPDDIYPDKPFTNNAFEELPPLEQLKQTALMEKQWAARVTPESLADMRAMLHISDKDNFTDEDVALAMLRAINKSRAKNLQRAYEPIKRIFGDREDDYVNHAYNAELSDPFKIGDQAMQDQWRAAMDGPDGILTQCFVLNQQDPRIPLQVGGSDNLNFGYTYA